MGDYLDNLVNRTLRPEAAVRPRLASLFEPPSPAAWAQPSTTDAFVSEEGPETSPTVTPHAPAPPTVTTARDAGAHTAGRDAANAPGALRPSNAPPAREREATSFERADTGDARPPAPRPNAETNAGVPHAGRSETRAVEESADKLRTGATARAGSDLRNLEGRVAALESAAPRRSRAGDTVRAAPQQAAPHVTPPDAARARRAEEPPRVTVRIGRVEVRAVSAAKPAASPPAPAPRAPALSLGEYLRQRERKRR